MTETPTRAATNGTVDHDDEDEAASGGSSLLDALPTDRLRQAAQALLKAATDKAVSAALEQVEGLTGRLSDVAENGGVGLTAALGGGKEALGGGNPVTGALKAGASAVKDKVTGALGIGGGGDDDEGEGEGSGSGSGGGSGGGGARGKFKFMNIFEAEDVGVPLRVAYDQWTQFGDFPSFMKKIENTNQESDEKVTWTAKVFWSRRSWETTIREQIPDTHIIWVSSGAKGRADGIVTFSELAPNLTRIVMILEYYPHGLFEKTGNIWRAVGRRARLEFKHFCRHVMMDTLINRDELEGWRGEIRDSEVVKTHEEAIEEEQRAAEGEEDEFDDEADDEFGDELEDDPDAEPDDEEPEDEFDDEADDEADDEFDDELDEDEAPEDELADDELDEEPEEEERPARRGRQRAHA